MIRTTTGRPRGRAARWAVQVTAAGALAGSLAGCSFSGSVEDAGSASTSPSLSTPTPSDAAGATPSASSSAADGSGAAPGTSGANGSAGSAGSTAAGSTAAGTTAPAGGAGGGTASCRTADLALSLLPGEGGASAGHQHFTIQFTNRGATACTLDGHPGVSLVTGDAGQQLGAAASREGSPAPVRLGAGASAYADLSVAQAGDYDAAQCQPRAAKGLRVYPPDQTAAAFVPADGLTGCASSSVVPLVVDPVVAGR